LNKEFYLNHWYADIYEQYYKPQENRSEEDEQELNGDLQYILSTIGTAPKRVLEVACGGGRLLEPIARAGHDVTGFDMDEYMLKKCEIRIKDLKNARCYKANAITEEWGKDYEVVVMGGNLLTNIEGFGDMDCEEAQRLFITKAAESLASNGRLFFACVCYAGHETSFDPEEYTIFSGKDDLGSEGQFTMFDQYDDGETRRHKSKRRIKIVTKDGEEYIKEWEKSKHYPSISKLRNWVAEAGLEIESEAGNYDGDPVTEQTEWAVVWAKKVFNM